MPDVLESLSDEELQAIANDDLESLSDDALRKIAGEQQLPDVGAGQQAAQREAMTHKESYPAVSKVDPKAIPEAMLKHAAKGITLGGSTYLVPKITGQPRAEYLQELEELREKAPLASSFAELGGAMALPGPKVKALGPQAGRVQKLLQRAKPFAAGAAEGGAYQALTSPTEEFGKEKLQEFFKGAGAGAAGVGAGQLGMKAAEGVRGIGPALKRKAYDDSVESLLSGSGKKIQDVISQKGRKLADDPEAYKQQLGEFMTEKKLARPFRTPLDTEKRAVDAVKRAGSQMDEVYQSIDQHGPSFDLQDFAETIRRKANEEYDAPGDLEVRDMLLKQADRFEDKVDEAGSSINLGKAQQWKNKYNYKESMGTREALDSDRVQMEREMHRLFRERFDAIVQNAEAKGLIDPNSVQKFQRAKEDYGKGSFIRELATDKADRIRKNNKIGLRNAMVGAAVFGGGAAHQGVGPEDFILSAVASGTLALAQPRYRQTMAAVRRGMSHLMQVGDPAIAPFARILRQSIDNPQTFALASVMLMRDNEEYRDLVKEMLEPMEGEGNEQRGEYQGTD